MEKTTTDLDAVATIGLDLGKHVFQVHAVDAADRVVVIRALRRKDVLVFFERLPSCLVGMDLRGGLGCVQLHLCRSSLDPDTA